MTDPTPHSPPPARNMADIARMFLDGVRQSPDAGNPKRTSPKERMNSQSPPASTETLQAPAPAESPAPSDLPLPRVMLTFVNDPHAANHAAAAANKLAKIHHATLGILSLQNHTLAIQIVGHPAGAPLPPIKSTAGQPDLQIARALFTLRHIVSHWMIIAPDTDSPEFPRLAAAIADWLLITPIGNDAVVAAYQELKRALAISSPANKPAAVMLSADPAAAATVHTRLGRAAAVFLNKDLTLAAVTPISTASPLQLAAFEVSDNPADHAAIYAAVLDELCGTLTETETDSEAPPEPAEEYEDEIIEPLDQLSPLAPLAPQPQQPFGGPPAPPALEDAQSQHSIDLDDPLDAATAAAVDLALNADLASASSSALFDHLTHVLDPEERDALNAELFDSESVTPTARSTSFTLEQAQPNACTPNTEPPGNPQPSTFTLAENQPEGCTLYTRVPTPPASPARSTGFSLEPVQPKGCTPNVATPSQQFTLRVHNLLTAPAVDRPAQWQAVLRAIPDLSPNSILLDAKPPMSWAAESALTLLPDGSLHVWMLQGQDASWFALKEWATEHRPLLALTHRALLLNTEAPITVHLVLPLKDSTPVESPALLRTPSPHLQLYRLHPLQWNTQHGIIVVPLS